MIFKMISIHNKIKVIIIINKNKKKVLMINT